MSQSTGGQVPAHIPMKPNKTNTPRWLKDAIWPNLSTLEEIDTMTTQNTPQEGVLRTSDPIRAAALLSFGIKLIDAIAGKDNKRKLIFVFDDTNDTARLASACFLQDRPVGVRTFTDNLRRCRELIYQYRISGEGR